MVELGLYRSKATWSAGDLIAVGVICKDEDTILEIVNADVLDEQLVLMVMNNTDCDEYVYKFSKAYDVFSTKSISPIYRS